MKKAGKFFVHVLMILAFVTVLTNCGGGGGGGASAPPPKQSGSGTLSDPYILQIGHTYSVPVMGYQAYCGYTLDTNCLQFDLDYVTTKVTVPQDGNYKVSFTGVGSSVDLTVYVFDSTGTYIGTIDDLGNGGNETASEYIYAGTYYLFLQMWGGKDTISVSITKI